MLGVRIIAEGPDAYFKFGDRVYIGKSNIICRTGIEFESDILVAWGVTFYDHDSHSLDYKIRRDDLIQQLDDYKKHKGNYIKNKNWEVVNSKPIKVCKDSWIGMNAIILKGVTIGEGAIVAACAVVTKDVPPFTVVAGNPAVVVKQLK
ncbi:MAG: acyltransferase [Flavobacterium sp.]|nr:acyltransferase [Flavobacterium sp.]